MSLSTSWKFLDLDSREIPKLLLRSHFDTSGYDIEVTDLSHIWREHVSRDEIIQRALDTGSSIDPGQDDEQLKIFLTKIEGALQREDKTTLDLSCGGLEGSTLCLTVSAALPHPLPAFSWTINLELQFSQHLESQLVTPLLIQASCLHQQIGELIRELHDKDRVISKICDRLETSGNDLTTVFPGVSHIKTSRKKGQREQLAKHVKGLLDFDENAWRMQHDRKREGDALEDGRVDEVFSDLPLPNFNAKGTKIAGEWWKNLDRGPKLQSTTADSRYGRASPQPSGTKTLADYEEESMQDEFQRQSTPPRLKRLVSPGDETHDHIVHASTQTNERQTQPLDDNARDDESTTDEDDDLDAVPRKQPPSANQNQATYSSTTSSMRNLASPFPRKLGTIGGRPPQPPTPPPKEVQPPYSTRETKPRRKLGTIGGRGGLPVPLSEPEGEKSVSTPPATMSKLGTIEGKKTNAGRSSDLTETREESVVPALIQDERSQRSRMPSKEQTPQIRETSQERADRKRDQLKRELEEKAKAPVKKKRKF